MHATKMHFAFLNSKSVNSSTPLGKMILSVAVRHHEQMEKELKDQERIRAIRHAAFEQYKRQANETMLKYMERVESIILANLQFEELIPS
jgi:Spy/CpxP family protein refolding chaperone